MNLSLKRMFFSLVTSASGDTRLDKTKVFPPDFLSCLPPRLRSASMVTFAISLLRTRLCPSDTLKPLSSNDVSCCSSASRTTFMSWCSRLCCGVARSNRSKTVGWCFPDIIEHAAEHLFPRLNEIWHVALAEIWGWKHLLLVVIHIEVWIYCQSWMELTDFARLCCHWSDSWSTNIDTTFENQVLRIIMNWLYCVRRCIWCELY